jgi:VanZ family protein
MRSPKPLTLLLFALAAFFTIGSNILIEKYQESGEQLLKNPFFTNELQGWEKNSLLDTGIAVNNGTVTLNARNKEGFCKIFQEIKTLGQETRFRLDAELKATDVSAGEKRWDQARLLLITIMDGKANYKVKHEVVSLAGNQGWQKYSKVFHIPKGTQTVQVAAQMSQCSGEFSLQNPHLYRVVESPLYTLSKWLALPLWGAFFISLLQPSLRGKGKNLSKLLLILTLTVIGIGITLSSLTKNNLRDEILQEAKSYTAPVKQIVKTTLEVEHILPFKLPHVDITKLAHFFLFALLALILLLINPQISCQALLINLLLIACSTELIQLYMEGRSPLFRDLVIDMAGGSVTVFLWRWLTLLKRT